MMPILRKNMRSLLYVLVVTGMLVVPAAATEKRREFSKFDSKKYKNVRIVVRQVLPGGAISGVLPPQNAVRDAAKRFFDAIDRLPEDFIKRSGVKYVTFLEQPTLKKVPVGGVARGDSIFLNINCPDKTIYHELFHIFDPHPKDRKWTRLNHKKFVYTGSDYYKAKLSSIKRKRKERNLSENTFDADFVSRYAMSNEREDRAETFAYMISEKKRFLQRAERSDVMRRKMEYIIDITGKRNLLGKEFWQEIFQQNTGNM